MNREERIAHREKLLGAVAYGHFRVGPGGATIAGYEVENGVLRYGIALRAPPDQFSKKQGREKAFYRLTKLEREGPRSDLSGVCHNLNPRVSLTSKLRTALVKHLSFYARSHSAPEWIKLEDKALGLMYLTFDDYIAGPNGTPWTREVQDE